MGMQNLSSLTSLHSLVQPKRVRQECKDSGPKKVVASVSVSLGGTLDATYPGELSRNEQQVSNYRKKQTKVCSATNSQLCTEANDLYAVML